ncbi:MAG: tRNA pseudouridine(55) synthase TruB [Candidatus Nanopelagicales bacterium]
MVARPSECHRPTAPAAAPAATDGIVVVDKPSGWTSHDVVARIRRLAGTRRVGHAGTLDPMATGVLVVGVGRATRLLGYLSGHDKSYAATIRLGWATTTDDAEGAPLGGAPAHGIPAAAVEQALLRFTGPIMQRPSAVSAIKVDGRRAHARVRAGESVELPARPVIVSRMDIRAMRSDPAAGVLDVDVDVDCSAGTYIRALARDLGESLGVGGHLASLRRTRVGAFGICQAHTLAELEAAFAVVDLATAARAAFPAVAVSAAEAAAVRHGRVVELPLLRAAVAEPHALFTAEGEFLALAAAGPDGACEYLAVFAVPR